MKDLWLNPLIKAARGGDDVAARALVGYLTLCLESGEVPPTALAEYFAAAFKKIAGGHSADAALNISGNTHYERDYAIAREVWKLKYRAENPLPFRDSGKKIGAYSTVSKKHHLGVDNVERIYKKMKWLIEAEFLDQPMDEEVRRHFEVGQHIAFAQLAETLKKRGSD